MTSAFFKREVNSDNWIEPYSSLHIDFTKQRFSKLGTPISFANVGGYSKASILYVQTDDKKGYIKKEGGVPSFSGRGFISNDPANNFIPDTLFTNATSNGNLPLNWSPNVDLEKVKTEFRSNTNNLPKITLSLARTTKLGFISNPELYLGPTVPVANTQTLFYGANVSIVNYDTKITGPISLSLTLYDVNGNVVNTNSLQIANNATSHTKYMGRLDVNNSIATTARLSIKAGQLAANTDFRHVIKLSEPYLYNIPTANSVIGTADHDIGYIFSGNVSNSTGLRQSESFRVDMPQSFHNEGTIVAYTSIPSNRPNNRQIVFSYGNVLTNRIFMSYELDQLKLFYNENTQVWAGNVSAYRGIPVSIILSWKKSTNTFKVYINGNLVGSGSTVPITITSMLSYYVACYQGGVNSWNKNVRHLMIYGSQLSDKACSRIGTKYLLSGKLDI